MRSSFGAVAVAGLMAATPALAVEQGLMSGDALRAAVSGRTVHLSTPIGALPISYRGNGTMTGEARMLAQYLGSDRDQGTWWIAAGKLCQRWKTWLDGAQYCYTMRRNGASVQWTRDDGRSGVATISQ